VYPLNPDIMFQEDRDRRAALMSARRGGSWSSRVRARLTRRRLEEVLVVEVPVTETPVAEAPAPVLLVAQTGTGPDVTQAPGPDLVAVPAQRLPGQLGPPAQGPVQPADRPATAAQDGTPTPEPAQAPTPPVAPSP
jgi:hypothetical protein